MWVNEFHSRPSRRRRTSARGNTRNNGPSEALCQTRSFSRIYSRLACFDNPTVGDDTVALFQAVAGPAPAITQSWVRVGKRTVAHAASMRHQCLRVSEGQPRRACQSRRGRQVLPASTQCRPHRPTGRSTASTLPVFRAHSAGSAVSAETASSCSGVSSMSAADAFLQSSSMVSAPTITEATAGRESSHASDT